MEILVTVADIASALGKPADALNTDKTSWLIDSARRRLLALVPSLNATQNQVKLALARDVLINAVARVLRNPRAEAGFASESEGDYSFSIAKQDAGASIWFPREDLALLAERPNLGVGSIKTVIPVRRLP